MEVRALNIPFFLFHPIPWLISPISTSVSFEASSLIHSDVREKVRYAEWRDGPFQDHTHSPPSPLLITASVYLICIHLIVPGRGVPLVSA